MSTLAAAEPLTAPQIHRRTTAQVNQKGNGNRPQESGLPVKVPAGPGLRWLTHFSLWSICSIQGPTEFASPRPSRTGPRLLHSTQLACPVPALGPWDSVTAVRTHPLPANRVPRKPEEQRRAEQREPGKLLSRSRCLVLVLQDSLGFQEPPHEKPLPTLLSLPSKQILALKGHEGSS